MFLCFELKKPSKFKLSIPIKESLSSDLVKWYYEHMFGDNWPVPSAGRFEKLQISINIYFFVFKEASACSYTDSSNHRLLPHPVSKRESFILNQASANTGARRFFDFYGRAFDLLENGALSISEKCGTRDNRNEAERTRDAIVGIQNWLSQSHLNIEVSGYTKNMRKYCPFTGGGDILFQCGMTSSTLFLHGEEDVEEEDVEKEDVEEEDVEREDVEREDVEREDVEREDVEREDVEWEDVEEEDVEEEEVGSRETIISGIIKATPTNDVCLQLQANMVLASAESLLNKIRLGELTLDQLDHMTSIASYGMSYGQDVQFQLLRCTFNFEKRTLSFECLFGPVYWLAAVKYVDAGIEYIVSQMTVNNE